MSYRSYSHRDEGSRGGGGGGGGSGNGSGSNQKETASEDVPPMSRLFVICNKSNTEEDIRAAFEQFGEIEEVWVVRNKQTGENKGKRGLCYSYLLKCISKYININSQWDYCWCCVNVW